MPVGVPALTADELSAIRLWIMKGAPETGEVADQRAGLAVGSLLNACLPPAKATPSGHGPDQVSLVRDYLHAEYMLRDSEVEET